MLVKIYSSVEELESCNFAKRAPSYKREYEYALDHAKRHKPESIHWLYCAFIWPDRVELNHFFLNRSNQFIVRRPIRKPEFVGPFCLALEACYPGYDVLIMRKADFFQHNREKLYFRASNWYSSRSFLVKDKKPRMPIVKLKEETFAEQWSALLKQEGFLEIEFTAGIAKREEVQSYLDEKGFVIHEEVLPVTLRSIK